jgi:hypothetical protein
MLKQIALTVTRGDSRKDVGFSWYTTVSGNSARNNYFRNSSRRTCESHSRKRDEGAGTTGQEILQVEGSVPKGIGPLFCLALVHAGAVVPLPCTVNDMFLF